MKEQKPKTGLISEAWTGPYRELKPGEEIHPDDLHDLHQFDGNKILVPVRIYGNDKNGTK